MNRVFDALHERIFGKEFFWRGGHGSYVGDLRFGGNSPGEKLPLVPHFVSVDVLTEASRKILGALKYEYLTQGEGLECAESCLAGPVVSKSRAEGIKVKKCIILGGRRR